ncbi:S8 family serine peptidase [Luedemannella flava]
MTGGTDLVDGGNGRVDCVGHGTAVASVIAAGPRSGSGLVGLAPGVKILPIRVTDRHDSAGEVVGSGLDAKGIATAVRRAIAARVDVINMSLSTATDDADLRSAIEDAIAADIVVVAAAGNAHDRGDPKPYPAAYPDVLGVGAIDASGYRVATSQVGTYVDIVAPGERVTGAQPGGGHAEMSGTSLATPFVAATAALLRQYRPDLDAAAVARRLLASADPAPGGRPSPEYGYGVLNPLRALTDVLPAAAARPRATPPAPSESAIAAPTGLSMSTAVPVAGAVISIALLVTLVAATVSVGRSRRWRPGIPPSRRSP